ncbi:MAG: response regulator transcription factor [Candidatus Omnitrophica bacterium]|nr:response regulator transcription factor [Candidatus Omnitrophota bacterium]
MTKKVLYIEDSPIDTRIVKEALEEAGITVDVAATGEEGFKKACQMKPDLILLDLILPDTDGFKLCAQIRKQAELGKTLVIVLSVKDEVDDIAKAFTVGADDYVIKPPLPDFLTKKIKLYLGMK